MVDWKKISQSFFLLGLLGIFVTFLLTCVQMTAMYAPPEMMAQRRANEAAEFLMLAAGVAILFLAGLISLLLGKREEQLPPSEEKQ